MSSSADDKVKPPPREYTETEVRNRFLQPSTAPSEASPCPNNAQRAAWAKNALTVLTDETFGGDHPDTMHLGDLESAIGDLICNLLHFANQKGMDARAIHTRALGMFDQEFQDDDDTVCTCSERSWYGAYHDTQCPLRIAADEHVKATEAI